MMDRKERFEAIELALTDYQDSKGRRSRDVEFRGESLPLEVVRINVNVPLLNHDNSRLRAQLKSHPKGDEVLRNPIDSASQEVLSELLRQTNQYAELCEQLDEKGQVEPGVITRDGMLVDGNTRLVALRDNGENGIDVALLPKGANDDDFFDVEASIQLRTLVHRDYTYTNQLLLVASLRERFESQDAIFKALDWQRLGPKRLAEHDRRLAIVEEARQLTGRPYEFFDNKEELIKDLDNSYQSLLQSDPEGAETLKQTRLFAMEIGLNKDEVRAIDEDFLGEHFGPNLEGTEAAQFFTQFDAAGSPSGLGGLIDRDDQPPTINIKGATKAWRDLPDDSPVKGAVFRNAKRASRNLIEKRIQVEMRTQPLEYVDQIAEKVDELTENLHIYFKDENFDKGKFQFRAKKMVKSIKELEQLLNRYL
jgi:hypothetical protein